MKRVKISEHEWNYRKDDGTYLLDEHVYYCFNFNDGFGLVQYNDYTENFVNTEGKRLLKTNVDYCNDFNEGFAQIRINKDYYLIDTEFNFYIYYNSSSFKKLYQEYPNMRSELIDIISKYTYFNVEEYFL